MAGMFSMLSAKLRTDGGASLPTTTSRDEAVSTKNNLGSRVHAPKRPAYKEATYNCKMWSAHPKDTGKHKVIDLHPVMRRSVCTLFLGLVFIISGIITIIVDSIYDESNISMSGSVVTGLGLFFVIVGMIWFYHSKLKLQRMWKIQEEKREKKMNFLMSELDHIDILPLAMITSKHVAKWPTRKSCNVAECQVKITSPNGNHYVSPEPSLSSDSEKESISPKGVGYLSEVITRRQPNGKSPDLKPISNGETSKLNDYRTINNHKQDLTETSFLGKSRVGSTTNSIAMKESVSDTTV